MLLPAPLLKLLAAAEAVTTLAAWRLHALDAVSIAAAALLATPLSPARPPMKPKPKTLRKPRRPRSGLPTNLRRHLGGRHGRRQHFSPFGYSKTVRRPAVVAKSNTGFYGDLDSRWVNIAPASFDEDRRKFFQALSSDINWGVWLSWSNRRINGVSDPEEIELVFATVPTRSARQARGGEQMDQGAAGGVAKRRGK